MFTTNLAGSKTRQNELIRQAEQDPTKRTYQTG